MPIAFQLSKINENSQFSELKSTLIDSNTQNENEDLMMRKTSSNKILNDNDTNSKRISPLKTFDSKQSTKSNRKSFYEDIKSGKNIKQIEEAASKIETESAQNDISDDSFSNYVNIKF